MDGNRCDFCLKDVQEVLIYLDNDDDGEQVEREVCADCVAMLDQEYEAEQLDRFEDE